jgi:general stress protein 26
VIDEDRVWDIIAKAGICMMVTRFAGGLRGRPLEARPNRKENAIFFLTDVRGLKDDEISADPHICLTFVYRPEKVYLSISGEALVSRDENRARELWNEEQQVWWPGGPGDENVRIIRVSPRVAEMWDGPASAAAVAHEFDRARATGAEPDLGENRKIRVELRNRR